MPHGRCDVALDAAGARSGHSRTARPPGPNRVPDSRSTPASRSTSQRLQDRPCILERLIQIQRLARMARITWNRPQYDTKTIQIGREKSIREVSTPSNQPPGRYIPTGHYHRRASAGPPALPAHPPRVCQAPGPAPNAAPTGRPPEPPRPPQRPQQPYVQIHLRAPQNRPSRHRQRRFSPDS